MIKLFVVIPIAFTISKIYKLGGFNDGEREVSK